MSTTNIPDLNNWSGHPAICFTNGGSDVRLHSFVAMESRIGGSTIMKVFCTQCATVRTLEGGD